MNLRRSKPLFAFLTMIAILVTSVGAFALERAADGQYHTGATVRKKRFIVLVDVYALGHMMKELPAQPTIQGVIDADVDKTFVLQMLRGVSGEKMTSAIGDAFKANGYADAARIAKFTAVFGEEVANKTTIRISYNAASKTTTASVSGRKTATIDGDAFMKAMWSCFLKNPDQPSMGPDLISKLKT